jgi:hypothetical protein
MRRYKVIERYALHYTTYEVIDLAIANEGSQPQVIKAYSTVTWKEHAGLLARALAMTLNEKFKRLLEQEEVANDTQGANREGLHPCLQVQ